MTDSEFWKTIKFFKPSEFKYPDKVSKELITKLDTYRAMVGKPIIIHSDYRPGDKKQHGKGLAIDFHVKGMKVLDQFFYAERSGLFVGIGIYPYWNNPGLHVDIREEGTARWGCDQKGDYVALTSDFVKDFIK